MIAEKESALMLDFRSNDSPGVSPLERIIRSLSLITLISTVPQVRAVWARPDPSGVSLISWVSYLLAACLWLVYGIQKRDKTIYLPCIGWIALDAAIVIGILVRT